MSRHRNHRRRIRERAALPRECKAVGQVAGGRRPDDGIEVDRPCQAKCLVGSAGGNEAEIGERQRIGY
jgi:hypothetical protein